MASKMTISINKNELTPIAQINIEMENIADKFLLFIDISNNFHEPLPFPSQQVGLIIDNQHVATNIEEELIAGYYQEDIIKTIKFRCLQSIQKLYLSHISFQFFAPKTETRLSRVSDLTKHQREQIHWRAIEWAYKFKLLHNKWTPAMTIAKSDPDKNS